MKPTQKRLSNIFIRYTILILLAPGNLAIFYAIFKPLTIYLDYFLFSIFFDAEVIKNFIYLERYFHIEFINACIAGAAYYLLIILNLSTPKIKLKKRIKLILISLGAFLLLNVLRIFILGIMFVNGASSLDVAHKTSWYLGSTLFIILIWFSQVKISKIKEIPFYSDVKFMIKQIRLKKTKKKKRK